jgi:hypothetical protein
MTRELGLKRTRISRKPQDFFLRVGLSRASPTERGMTRDPGLKCRANFTKAAALPAALILYEHQ